MSLSVHACLEDSVRASGYPCMPLSVCACLVSVRAPVRVHAWRLLVFVYAYTHLCACKRACLCACVSVRASRRCQCLRMHAFVRVCGT